MGICKVSGCDKPKLFKKTGYCAKHHRKFIRYGDPLAMSLRWHGMSGTYEYELWQNIKTKYPICDSWRVFAEFYVDIGEKPTYDHHLKRIDIDQPFGPNNFKWVTKKERVKVSIDKRHIIKVYTSFSDVPPETIQAIYKSKTEGMTLFELCAEYHVCTRLMLEILRKQ